MNTDAKRRANAAYHAKRESDGYKKVTLWLSPEARSKLDALKSVAGSKDKAADQAILAWGGPDAPKPVAEKPLARAAAKVQREVEAIVAAKARPADVQIASVEVPIFQRRAFNPQPKKGKAK